MHARVVAVLAICACWSYSMATSHHAVLRCDRTGHARKSDENLTDSLFNLVHGTITKVQNSDVKKLKIKPI